MIIAEYIRASSPLWALLCNLPADELLAWEGEEKILEAGSQCVDPLHATKCADLMWSTLRAALSHQCELSMGEIIRQA
jgi:hypothetical protein